MKSTLSSKSHQESTKDPSIKPATNTRKLHKHDAEACTGVRWLDDPFEDDVTSGDAIKNQTPNPEEYKK